MTEKKKAGWKTNVAIVTLAGAALWGSTYFAPRTEAPTSENYAVRAPAAARHAPHTLPEDSVTLETRINQQYKSRVDLLQVVVDQKQYDFMKQYDKVWCEINAAPNIQGMRIAMTINKKTISSSPFFMGPRGIPTGGPIRIYGVMPDTKEEKMLYETILTGK